ncbi:MAG: co-chaperone GroES [Akkermansia sp.]
MIKPLGNRVLVERVEAETKTAGGLFLPDTAKEKPQEAIVRAIGTGARDKDGNVIPFNVAVNDKVLITKYGGTEVSFNGTTYTILSESDILAVID